MICHLDALSFPSLRTSYLSIKLEGIKGMLDPIWAQAQGVLSVPKAETQEEKCLLIPAWKQIKGFPFPQQPVCFIVFHLRRKPEHRANRKDLVSCILRTRNRKIFTESCQAGLIWDINQIAQNQWLQVHKIPGLRYSFNKKIKDVLLCYDHFPSICDHKMWWTE